MSSDKQCRRENEEEHHIQLKLQGKKCRVTLQYVCGATTLVLTKAAGFINACVCSNALLRVSCTVNHCSEHSAVPALKRQWSQLTEDGFQLSKNYTRRVDHPCTQQKDTGTCRE